MKFVSVWFRLEQRWNGSSIDEDVRLDVAPHFRKPKGDDHGATILYALCNCLHQRATFECFFQIGKLQDRGCVWVVPGCLCQLDNRLSREFGAWIKRPAQFVQYRIRVVLVEKSEWRYFLLGRLQPRKLRRGAFHGDLVHFQGAFEAAHKT